MQRKNIYNTRRLQLGLEPAPHRTTRTAPKVPTSGYVLVVDGQMKGEFKTSDAVHHRAESLKRRFPALQVRIFDAQEKRFENVEPAKEMAKP
jgi:hypothetical protein